jgi:hypothetical protein
VVLEADRAGLGAFARVAVFPFGREVRTDARREADRARTVTFLEGLGRRAEAFLVRAVAFRLVALLVPALRPAPALRVTLDFDLAMSTLLLATWTLGGSELQWLSGTLTVYR